MDDSLILALFGIGLIVLPTIGIIAFIVRSGRRQAQRLTPLRSSNPNSLEAIRQMSVPNAYQKMLSDVRSWGWTLVVFGIIHLVATNFLNLSFGLLLIAIGALSFLVREPSMFILYAVTLAWAAIGNMLAFDSAIGWALFGLFQVFLSAQVFRRFFVFKKVHKDYTDSLTAEQPQPAASQPTRTDQIFPFASLVAGSWGFIGAACGYVALVAVGATQQTNLLNIAGLTTDVAVIVGVLGFALGLAALLSDSPRRALSIIGLAAGGLTILMMVGLNVLARVAG